MQSYGYLGASWANNAGQRRQDNANRMQAFQQYAPQISQYNVGSQQFKNQRGQNQLRQQSDMFGFGINALAGLMK